ncbi:MAG: hypothetical protein E7158_06185 [Firmicutes bacterium]|nr:hypothetical protein [Bacillota bacterium]
MEFWLKFLPIIIYFLLIIILVIGIILGIKSINTLNKVEKVVDDVNDKVKSLNGFFSIIDFTTDKIALLTDKTVEGISALISRLFINRKKKKKGNEEENE